MKRIVLLRHGESLWNKENRFTGWTDVDLSEKGVEEACKAGDALREAGFSFEAAYTSYLKRAVKTLNCVLDPEWSTAQAVCQYVRFLIYARCSFDMSQLRSTKV